MKLVVDQFRGLGDTPAIGSLMDAQNVRIKDGKLYTIPDVLELYVNVPTDLGLYVFGHGDATVLVAFGSLTPSSHVFLTIIDYLNDQVTQYDLASYGVPAGHYVPAAVVGDSMWFVAGDQIFEISFTQKKITSGSTTVTYKPLTVIPQVMVLGYEAGTASYLVDPPSATISCVHQGRVFYAGLSSKMYRVTSAVDPTDVPALAALATDTKAGSTPRWGYKPNMVIFSEPYMPNAVKVWSFLTIEDPKSRITGLVSYMHSLFIFTETGVWQYSGDDPLTAVLEKVPNMEGCVNHQTIQVVGDTLFWLGPTGINYISPKDRGQIQGIDRFFGHIETPPFDQGQTWRVQPDRALAAGANVWGYYLLKVRKTLTLVVDVQSKAVTYYEANGNEITAMVGVGNAAIGGAFCDVILGIDSTRLAAFLWDGRSGESQLSFMVPDIHTRVPWRTVTTSIYGAGRVRTYNVALADGVHLEQYTPMTTGVKPAGWENMAVIGGTTNPFKIGTSTLLGSGTRQYKAEFSTRSSNPLVYATINFQRSTRIEGFTLEGGPSEGNVGRGENA